MSAWGIEIKDGASAPLHQILTAVTKPKPVFEAIGADLEAEVQLGFASGETPHGEPWRHPVFRDGQPLRDTGRLMNSITHAANDAGVEVGTNVCYAATHQFGVTINAKPGQTGSNACGSSKGAPRLVFPGPGGALIFAKSVTIPARPFLPTEKTGLPEHWWTAIESRFAKAMGVTK